jgi:exodeoxyribonuclease III
MQFTVATWNINSVRLRMRLVGQFLSRYAPDVLCLQETKCPDDRFPRSEFERFGYSHIAMHGQKGYHGVAIVSKHPFSDVSRDSFCGKNDARHIAVSFDGRAHFAQPLTVHNFYVPAGGDQPDPEINEKFAQRALLVGDLNVAPLEHDVWSHQRLLGVVSHTPIEVEKLNCVQQAGRWIDVMRGFIPEPEKLYTWWSYRAADWVRADRGRRLDHVWASPALQGTAKAIAIARETRSWTRPSDHVPVVAAFDL